MKDGSVRFERVGAVGRIVFDRPAARNAMTWAMYRQLGEICARLAAERPVRVAVLRGVGGKTFVAGTDIAGFKGFTNAEDGVRYEDEMDASIGAIEALPMPTVAVVEGLAVGGGLAIATACDFRVSTRDAKFGVPIARTLGNCLSARGYTRLVGAIGAARAKRLILLGDMLDAKEGLEAGYLLAVADSAKLDALVDDLCSRLLGNAPLTQEVSKEAIRRITYASLPDIDDLIRRVYGSEDFRRGVRAFLDKQTPDWTGR